MNLNQLLEQETINMLKQDFNLITIDGTGGLGGSIVEIRDRVSTAKMIELSEKYSISIQGEIITISL